MPTLPRSSPLWLLSALTIGAAPEEARLWFHSGFEGDVSVAEKSDEKGRDQMRGIDGQTGMDWATDLPAAFASFAYHVTSEPTRDYERSAVLPTTDAAGRPTQALRMDSLRLDPGNRPGLINRNELSLFEPGYAQAYIRYRLRLQPDYAELCPADETASWRMFFELKEPDSGVQRVDGKQNRRTGTNNYRISCYIRRKADGAFMWHVRGEAPQPVRTVDWDIFNDAVPVPLGEWFTLEVAFNHGDEANGFFWMAVDGQQVAYRRGRTQHPDNPLPLKFWSPFKLYASPEWLAAGPLYQWIDDVAIWSDFPTDATPRDAAQANLSTYASPIEQGTAASSPSPTIR